MILLPEHSVTTPDVVHHMDALSLLHALPSASADLIATDPPYGAGKVSAWRSPSERFEEIANNDHILTTWLSEAYRVLRDGGAMYCFSKWQVFGEWQEAITSAGFAVRNCIVWDKKVHGTGDLDTCYGPQHELILFAAKRHHVLNRPRPIDIVRIAKVPPQKLVHPYQKPVALMEWIIGNSTKPGALIIDPFCGSGSTLKAAQQTGRHFVGCDIDAENVALARDLLAQGYTLSLFSACPA